MTLKEQPTAGAQRAMGLAELVNKVFTRERIPSSLEGHAGYRVAMAGPDALSTTERKGALDHLKLVPLDPARVGAGEGTNATLLIGTADPNLSQLELRTYDRLQQLHEERFKGAKLPLDEASYEALRKKLEEFFERQGIATIASNARSDVAARARAPSGVAGRRSPVPILVVIGAILVLAIAAIGFLFRSR
jgi:hypothetical protein